MTSNFLTNNNKPKRNKRLLRQGSKLHQSHVIYHTHRRTCDA